MQITAEAGIAAVSLVILVVTNIVMLSRFMTKIEAKIEAKPDERKVKNIFNDEIKMYPTSKEVDEMIDKKVEGHCPYADTIKRFDNWREKRTDLLNDLKMDVQQIRINVQMLCEKMDVDYKK